jgi:hypothetical protein
MNKRFIIIVIFSIGLAFIEAVVVVYLRTIFYPEGFVFPLVDFISDKRWLQFLGIETCREAATLAVLFSSSWLFGKDFRTRLAYFLTIFAVWDIFYYVWLKVLLGWPSSIMEWDILFLIPVPWAGPVLAPVVLSLTMLIGAILILHRESCGRPLWISRCVAYGFILVGLLFVGHFCYAGRHVSQIDYKSYFNWLIFLGCEIAAIILMLKCTKKRAG